MFRARFASIVVAAGLASSGCQCFDHPWFHSSRDHCVPAPCATPCDPCASGCGVPVMDGPMLPPQEAMLGGACLPQGALMGSPGQLPPGAIPVMPGQLPPGAIPGQLPPGAIPAVPGQMPAAGQPRLVPTPQSVPMPYSPH